MKKVIVIGATGSLASYVIDELKKRDDVKLTLFVRDKARLNKKHSDLKVFEGDAMNYSQLKNAVAGHDIVYVNLAGDLETMTTNIVHAMRDNGISRIIGISSIGIYQTPLKPVLQSYRKLADVIEASGLDYTILRPDWFTNAEDIDYALTKKGEPESGTAISRKSIASFIGTIVDNPVLQSRQNLGISKPN